MMKSLAVVMEEPQRLALRLSPARRAAALTTSSSKAAGPASAPAPSGCSTPAGCRRFPAWAIRWCPATRRSARSSARVRDAGVAVGANVFVPGARCFGDVRGLHGGSASHLVAPGARVVPIDAALGERGVLLALAATALHAAQGRAPRRADPHRRPRRARPVDRAPGGGARRWRRSSGKPTPSAPSGALGYDVIDARATIRAATIAPSSTSAATRRRSTRSSSASRRADASRSPASTTPSASPSRPPSCARRRSASPRNGRPATSPKRATWSQRARCRLTASSPTGAPRARPPKPIRPLSATRPA